MGNKNIKLDGRGWKDRFNYRSHFLNSERKEINIETSDLGFTVDKDTRKFTDGIIS